MGYVIYDKASTKLKSKAYKTHAAAQAALTRMNKSWAANYDKLGNEADAPVFTMGIAEVNYYYENIERKVVKQNLMSGKDYEESVNTPLHMSPASETYWSA